MQRQECLDTKPIRAAIEDIDSVYEEVAKDKTTTATQETNTIINTDAPGNDLKEFKKKQKANSEANATESAEKMSKAYNVLRKMYGMDDED